MGIKRAIIEGFHILSEPTTAFKRLKSRTFEDVLEDYIKLLLLSGFLAGLMAFIYQFTSALYIDLFKGVFIDYWRLVNYAFGNSTGIFFFYLFAGTLLIFLVSALLKIFFRKPKLVNLIAVVLYSLTPFLFFGWIIIEMSMALVVWCIFLFIIGIKKH